MGSGIGKRANDKAVTALERIERLEKGFQTLLGNQQGLLEGSNRAFSMTEDRLSTQELLCEAITDLLGRSVVEEAIKARIQATQQKQADEQREGITKALEEGQLIVGVGVTEQSIVTGRHVLKDGTFMHPGWQQIMLNQVKPEFKDSMLGKKVGESVEVPVGHFEILGVYEIPLIAPTQSMKSEPEMVVAGPMEGSETELPTSEDVAELPEPDEKDAAAAFEEYMADGPA